MKLYTYFGINRHHYRSNSTSRLLVLIQAVLMTVATVAQAGSINYTQDPNAHFRLDTWTGTPPTLVNNTISGNQLGYETYFDFSSSGSFRYYEFLYSTLTQQNIGQGEWEEELGGVAAATPSPAPEPASLALLGTGVIGLGGILRRGFLL